MTVVRRTRFALAGVAAFAVLLVASVLYAAWLFFLLLISRAGK